MIKHCSWHIYVIVCTVFTLRLYYLIECVVTFCWIFFIFLCISNIENMDPNFCHIFVGECLFFFSLLTNMFALLTFYCL